jgi:transposase
MGGHLLMSEKERIRKVIFEGVKEGRLSVREASVRLGISYRQGKRIYRRFRRKGDAGLVHKGRGRPSNRAMPSALREKAIARYRDRYEGFGPTLAAEKLSAEGLSLDHETLRRWLVGAGLWKSRSPKARHRTYRERKRRFGELVQLDGSLHRWFGNEEPLCCLMDMVDDATGTTRSLMLPHESTEAAMRILRQWVERHGIPLALYTDRHTIYLAKREPTLEEALAGEGPLTALGKACRKLSIKILTAYSPQAKGRVERKHGVYQDRFRKELALLGIRTIPEANAVLENGFVEDLNRRFAVSPADPVDAHRPVPKGLDLDQVFCFEERRTLQNDYTIRHENRWYQITRQNRPLPRPQNKILVRTHLDGKVDLWWRDRPLAFVPLAGTPEKRRSEAFPRPAPSSANPPRAVPQAPDHPWRQPFDPESALRWRRNEAQKKGTFLTSPNGGHF